MTAPTVDVKLPKNQIDLIRKYENELAYLRKRAAGMRDLLSGKEVEFDEQTKARLEKKKMGKALLAAGAGRDGGFQTAYLKAFATAKGLNLDGKPLVYQGADEMARQAAALAAQEQAWLQVGELYMQISKINWEIEIAEKGIRDREDALAGVLKVFHEAVLVAAKSASVAAKP